MADIYDAPHNIPSNWEYLDTQEELDQKLDQISPYVGRVIIELNSLETLIDLATKEIASISEGQDKYIYAFLSKMDFIDKIDILTTLYGDWVEYIKNQNLRDSLKKLKTRLVNSCQKRNVYAHTDWSGIDKKNMVAVKLSANREGIFRVYRTFNISDMEEDINYIIESAEQLDQFDEEFHDSLQNSSPGSAK